MTRIRKEAATQKLTPEETLRILSVAKRRFPPDWLILRLIVEHGFKIGEIVGSHSGRANLPGIKIKDLVRNEIVMRRNNQRRISRTPISSQLMRMLQGFAGTRPQEELLFEHTLVRKTQYPDTRPSDPVPMVLGRVKSYAQKAGIPFLRMPTESLRNVLASNQIGLVEFDGDIAGEALVMADFYALNYCLERSVRKLILETLEKYDDWWGEKRIPKDVIDYYKGVRKREDDSDTLLNRPGSYLNYLTFGHLMGIIQFNWDDFKDKFVLGREKPVTEALAELHELRHMIAHSCELNEIDQNRFKVAMNKWLGQLIAA